jgi:TonB family protein
MVVTSLLFAAALAQAPGALTDCTLAVSRGTSGVTTQVCLAEAELARAGTVDKGTLLWRRHMEDAAALYKKAFTLPADAVLKTAIVERLLVIYDAPGLNDEAEMLAAFGELIGMAPTDVAPLFRLATYQEARGSVEAAEETLLSARRLQPGDIEPVRMLARFYARRAGAMHARAQTQEVRDQTVPGSPDRNGVYQVGGGVTPPRRLGNAAYPSDALAAGIDGVVTAEILVSEQGVVTDARVVKSVPLLDEAALTAVREWRYDPTIVDGKAVPVKMTVTVAFSRSQR